MLLLGEFVREVVSDRVFWYTLTGFLVLTIIADVVDRAINDRW